MTVSLTYTKEMDKSHMVMPGDNCELVCEVVHPIALDKGMRFTIRTTFDEFFSNFQVKED